MAKVKWHLISFFIKILSKKKEISTYNNHMKVKLYVPLKYNYLSSDWQKIKNKKNL